MSLASVQLFETTYGTKPLRVDREKCIVYGVKILGEQSRNPAPHNNQYPKSTREKVRPLLEGSRCFINHDEETRKRGGTRKYQDSFGIHRNVRDEQDGSYSDFHYNPKHQLAEQFVWDAEHAPENVGFSIATFGKKRVAGGVSIVEEITFNRDNDSVDLVCRGATTNSLFEGARMSTKQQQTVKAWLAEHFKDDAAKLRIVEEELPAGAATDASMPAPAEGSAEDPMDAGFGAMVHKLADSYIAGDIDLQGFVAKLKDIDKAWTKLSGETQKADAGAASDTAPAKEGATVKTDPTLATLQEELRVLKHENLAAKVAASVGVVPTTLLTRALKSASNEAEMKAICEEFKALTPAGKGSGSGDSSTSKTRSAGTGAGTGAGAGGAAGGAAAGSLTEGLKPSAMTAADRVAYLRNGKLPTPAAAK